MPISPADGTDDDEKPPAGSVEPGRGERFSFVADKDRLDRALAKAMPSLSRSRLQALIKAGHVLADGLVQLDPGFKLHGGESVALSIPPPEDAEPRPEAIPLNIAYEDKDLIVVDKPAGLVVHPAAGHGSGTLVNALIAHCGESLSGIGGVRRPGIVHRLDKDTSGLLVVAKTDAAHAGLSDQFAQHGADGRLERAYLAVVWGVPPRKKGVVDAALSRSVHNRVKISVVPEGEGRHAVTHYDVLETFAGDGASKENAEPVASLVQLVLETGRTHQIRVHMAHIGHPLLGDPTYGRGHLTRSSKLSEAARAALAALGRQALHAAELGFEHPVSGKALRFRSDLPADLQSLLEALRRTAAPDARRRGGKVRRN